MTLTPDELRAELDQILPRRTPDMKMTTMGAGSDDLEDGRRYLAATVAGGWGVPSWPAGMGGRGADPDEARTIGTVLREYAVPDLYAYAVGLGMVGPTVLAHGSEEQQQRWLHNIASGAEIWCQMFSEPEAGSDLGALRTRAQARPDGSLTITGDKIFISGADHDLTDNIVDDEIVFLSGRIDEKSEERALLLAVSGALDLPGEVVGVGIEDSDVLPPDEIRRQVTTSNHTRLPVYRERLDDVIGIVHAIDVVKALALGARAVLLGRSLLWGLAVNGEAGAGHVLDLLAAELDLAMALCGARSLADFTPDLIA